MGMGTRVGVILVSPEGNRLRYAIRIYFSASNNVAEYEGLINGLRIAVKLGATRLLVYGDSKLVVDQTMKEANCNNPLMEAYCQEVCKLEASSGGIELHHLPRKTTLMRTSWPRWRHSERPRQQESSSTISTFLRYVPNPFYYSQLARHPGARPQNPPESCLRT